MILIITEETDFTTRIVIDWLNVDENNFFVINSISVINSIYIALSKESKIGNEIILTIDEKQISLNRIETVWYRKADLFFDFKTKIKEKINNLNNHLNEEWIAIREFIFYSLERKKHLGDYFRSTPNKIRNLVLAKDSGLSIPETLITTNKKEANTFLNKQNAISKPIQDIYVWGDNTTQYVSYTKCIDKNRLEEHNDKFFPSLFQENIKKRYELRVFFIGHELYSMAIFSQDDKNTETDFRNYNYDKITRQVPFNLPEKVKKYILKFIKKVELNIGVIDMIVTHEFEYVFLEVNPTGQFTDISINCNYNLEKKVASFLCCL